MGINYHAAGLLLRAKREGFPLQRVLTLGRQELNLTPPMVDRLSRLSGQDLSGLITWDDCVREVYAEEFFARLGVKELVALDFSDYQGATLRHDLNQPLPARYRSGFDLIYDGGTLEHVFNFPVAIRNCMDLLRVGGHFLSSSPADQQLGHGFYQFSPELFFRIFSPENGFEMKGFWLGEADGRLFEVSDPREQGRRTTFAARKPAFNLFAARKREDMETFGLIPQQSDYATRWGSLVDSQGAAPEPVAKGLKALLPLRLRRSWWTLRYHLQRLREPSSGLRRVDEIL